MKTSNYESSSSWIFPQHDTILILMSPTTPWSNQQKTTTTTTLPPWAEINKESTWKKINCVLYQERGAVPGAGIRAGCSTSPGSRSHSWSRSSRPDSGCTPSWRTSHGTGSHMLPTDRLVGLVVKAPPPPPPTTTTTTRAEDPDSRLLRGDFSRV